MSMCRGDRTEQHCRPSFRREPRSESEGAASGRLVEHLETVTVSLQPVHMSARQVTE